MTTNTNSNTETPLIKRAKTYLISTIGQKQDGRLLVHNYALSIALSGLAFDLGSKEQLTAEQLELVQLAALFLPSGFYFNYQQPASYSIRIASQFFDAEPSPYNDKALVLELINRLLNKQGPSNAAGKVLSDSYYVHLFLLQQEERHPLLQLERDFMLTHRYTKAEWAKLLLDELLRVQLYTHAAQAQYQPVLAQAIHKYRLEVEKRAIKAVDADKRFTELEKKVPVRGVQTYFRSNYRNHINLSAIADNKANIMIGINAILISVLITFLSYRNIGENQPQVLLPLIIFLASGLASLIFAVLAVRPKVTMVNPEGTTIEEAKRNITFFGNFVTLELEEYEEAMDEVFSDSSLLYGNMVRDLYFLGKVLEKKYRFLSMSYNLFMVGFIATVLSFVIVLFS
jgi:hypothetical protein